MAQSATFQSRLRLLHDAIKRCDVNAVGALIAADDGDAINAEYDRHTAMTRALHECPDDVIPMTLLRHGRFNPSAVTAVHQRSALDEAVGLGRDDLVRELLRVGANVNARRKRSEETPLHTSASKNRPSSARILLTHGADVNAQNLSGDTPLHCACASGSEEVVTVLLEHPGCDVKTVNKANQMALFSALPSAYNVQVRGQPLSRALSICKQLLRAACGVISASGSAFPGSRLLLRERVLQDDVVGACLLLHHCPFLIEVTDDQGMTPLELAVSRFHYEMALCLLRYGASARRLFSCSVHLSENLLLGHPTGNAAPGGPSGASSIANDFHRLHFLQALLSSSFVTSANLGYLVPTGLLTPDLVAVVRAASAAVKSDPPEKGEGKGSERFRALRRRGWWESSASGLENEANGFQGGQARLLSRLLDTADEALTTISTTQQYNVDTVDPKGSWSMYAREAAGYACAALRQSLSLEHQSRLAVRRKLASAVTSLPSVLPTLGLPKRVQNFISLGADMAVSSPLDVAELHVAVTENDVSKVRQLLQDGVNADLPLMKRTPLTRALELQPSHNDVFIETGSGSIGDDRRNDVVADKFYLCRLCSSQLPGSVVEVIADENVNYKVNSLHIHTGTCSKNSEAVPEMKERNMQSLPSAGYPGTPASFSSTSKSSPRILSDVAVDPRNDCADVISLLLRHGASVTLRDPLGDTPLHVAVSRGSCVVERFMDAVASAVITPASVKCPSNANSSKLPNDLPHAAQDSLSVDAECSSTLLTSDTDSESQQFYSRFAFSQMRDVLGSSRNTDHLEDAGCCSGSALIANSESKLLSTPGSVGTASPCGASLHARSTTSGIRWMWQVLDPIRTTDRLGLSPLELALLNGDLVTVRLLLNLFVPTLLNAVAENDTQASSGWSAPASPRTDDADVAKAVLSANTENGHEGDPIAADVLMPAGSVANCAVHLVPSVSETDETNRKEMTEARGLNGADAAGRLVSWVGGATGVTVLHCAAAAGFPEVAKALVTLGTSRSSRDVLGNTPSDVAACGSGKVLYRRDRHLYCPHWYDNAWKSMLRVWPKCQPRPFSGRHLQPSQ